MSADTIDDPFERAVRRESAIRRRLSALPDEATVIRFIAMWMLVIAATWAAILTGHWLVFPEPRWLVVLHTVVFALVVAFGCIAFFAQRQLARLHRPSAAHDD